MSARIINKEAKTTHKRTQNKKIGRKHKGRDNTETKEIRDKDDNTGERH
jgi:hypothetical protein